MASHTDFGPKSNASMPNGVGALDSHSMFIYYKKKWDSEANDVSKRILEEQNQREKREREKRRGKSQTRTERVPHGRIEEHQARPHKPTKFVTQPAKKRDLPNRSDSNLLRRSSVDSNDRGCCSRRKRTKTHNKATPKKNKASKKEKSGSDKKTEVLQKADPVEREALSNYEKTSDTRPSDVADKKPTKSKKKTEKGGEKAQKKADVAQKKADMKAQKKADKKAKKSQKKAQKIADKKANKAK